MLRIRNLTCGYDSKIILHGIDLDVEEGELIGVIGPNGSGKTTLIRAVSRVLKPASGEVMLDGKNIWQTGFKELARKIAVVPQAFSGGTMSVEEFVLLGRIPHFTEFQFLETQEDLKIAKESMVLTDTYGLKDRLMKETSGGERQLALVSRALAQQPRLLLLDEPTAHLDIAHQVRILDLIRRLNKELGLTVIIVLHDLNLASEYCRRLVLINEGRIHKVGLPEEVIRYQIIEEVYKTVVVVKENPVSFKPCVFLVSEEDKLKRS